MGVRVMQLMTTISVVVACVATTSGLGLECGDNPMTEILLVAKRTGRSLNGVLILLRHIDTAAYESLSNQFLQYAACVGLLDTGYFRKRASPWSSLKMAPTSRTSQKRNVDAMRYLKLRWMRALVGLNEPRRLADAQGLIERLY